MPGQPDISYRIVTSSDNAGLVSHTAAVKADTTALAEQKTAMAAVTTGASQEVLQWRDPVTGRYTKPGVFTDVSGAGAGASQATAAVAQNEATAASMAKLQAAANAQAAAFWASVDAEAGATAASEAYQITTEAEYLKAQQLLAKLTELQLSKQLLGVTDTQLAAKIATLDAALSTESALTIAQTVETKAEAEAKAAAAAAAEADAAKRAANLAAIEATIVAEREDAIATEAAAAAKYGLGAAADASAAGIGAETAGLELNTIAMRESMVIARELTTGQITRLPGSLALMLQNVQGLNISLAQMLPVLMGGFVAWSIGRKLVKEYEESVKDLRAEIHEYSKETDLLSFKVQETMQKSRDAAHSFDVGLQNIVQSTDTVTQRLEQMNRVQKDSSSLAEAYSRTRETAALAAAGEVQDPVKRAQAEADIKAKFARQEVELQDELARKELHNQQLAADATKRDFDTKKANADALEADMEAKQAALLQVQTERKQQETLYKRLASDLGLTDEDIDKIRSGQYSFGELTGYRKDEGGAYTETGPGQITRDKLQSMFGPHAAALDELQDIMTKLGGLYGGKPGEQLGQEKRELEAQQAYDRAKRSYDDAAGEAKKMATELETVTRKLNEMGAELDAQSALRNQQARESQIKLYEETRSALDEQLKKDEELRQKGTPVPGEADLKSKIADLDRKIQAIASLPQATSTLHLPTVKAPEGTAKPEGALPEEPVPAPKRPPEPLPTVERPRLSQYKTEDEFEAAMHQFVLTQQHDKQPAPFTGPKQSDVLEPPKLEQYTTHADWLRALQQWETAQAKERQEGIATMARLTAVAIENATKLVHLQTQISHAY